MELYTENAEKELLRYVKDIKKNSPKSSSWHCLFCSLRDKYSQDKNIKNKLIELMEISDLIEREISIFWLSGGHIFIFTQGAITPIEQTLEDIFHMAIEDDPRSHIKPVIIDLRTDWDLFEVLVRAPSDTQTVEKLVTVQAPQDAPPKRVVPEMAGTVDLRGKRRLRHKPVLLSIEDQKITQTAIQKMMEPYCDIVIANNAEEGKKLYDQVLPSIVFMDIQLPDGDGKDLTQEFCEKDPEAFIVMVSGNLSQETIDECMLHGARGFISKPLNKQQNRLLYFVNLYNAEHRKPGPKKKRA